MRRVRAERKQFDDTSRISPQCDRLKDQRTDGRTDGQTELLYGSRASPVKKNTGGYCVCPVYNTPSCLSHSFLSVPPVERSTGRRWWFDPRSIVLAVEAARPSRDAIARRPASTVSIDVRGYRHPKRSEARLHSEYIKQSTTHAPRLAVFPFIIS